MKRLPKPTEEPRITKQNYHLRQEICLRTPTEPEFDSFHGQKPKKGAVVPDFARAEI
jgi:hypothetical protein